MRVVIVGRGFPTDDSHLLELSDSVDLTIYGTRRHAAISGITAPAQAPRKVRSRTVRPLLETKRELLWYYPMLGRLLTVDRPDVVHVVSEPWGLLAVHAAVWARRRTGTAILFQGCDTIWCHGPLPERVGRTLLARFSLARADGYVGENARAVELVRDHGLAAPAATDVINSNPRDPEVFRPAAGGEERLAARRRLGLPAEGVGIGFVGRLVEEKGPLLFLDALRRASAASTARAWAAVAGTGPLQEEVSRQGGEAGVHSLGRLRYPEEVATFYRAIDVYVAPSWGTDEWEDQGPRSLLEAMMSGCAVIGSRSGGIPEMIGDVGALVKERDASDLADAIERAVDQAADRQLRTRVRERAIALYSGSAVAGRLVVVWKRALARRRALADA